MGWTEGGRGKRTWGSKPGTKLKGMPMAMTANATSLELPWNTGARICVEKYMTGKVSILQRDAHRLRLTRGYAAYLLGELRGNDDEDFV